MLGIHRNQATFVPTWTYKNLNDVRFRVFGSYSKRLKLSLLASVVYKYDICNILYLCKCIDVILQHSNGPHPQEKIAVFCWGSQLLTFTWTCDMSTCSRKFIEAGRADKGKHETLFCSWPSITYMLFVDPVYPPLKLTASLLLKSRGWKTSSLLGRRNFRVYGLYGVYPNFQGNSLGVPLKKCAHGMCSTRDFLGIITHKYLNYHLKFPFLLPKNSIAVKKAEVSSAQKTQPGWFTSRFGLPNGSLCSIKREYFKSMAMRYS